MESPDPRPTIGTSDSLRAIETWLFVVAAMVLAIVAVGGITRLTESGLSIVEWKPVTGAIPPLSEAAWQAEFEAYKQIPQYSEMNLGMSLAEYKFIYFWEWVHRLLARFIGLAFALPLAWFWIRGTIPKGYKPRLLALLALGGLQGAVGWWMVSSGLSADVKVSHYRLAVHLLVALTTLGGLVWTALDIRALQRGERRAAITGLGMVALAILFVQLLLGAFVAGLRAGVVAGGGWFDLNSWPLMQGRLVPEGIGMFGTGLAGLAADPFLTHFLHRWWAFVVVAILVVLARHVRRTGHRAASIALHSAVGFQVLLGIATVWSGVALWLGVAHQFVGAILVGVTVWCVHIAGRTPGGAQFSARPLVRASSPS